MEGPSGTAVGLELGLLYRLSGALGAELQRLSERCGAGAVAGLVPLVVRLLELLEALAVAGTEDTQLAPALRRALRRLPTDKEGDPDAPETGPRGRPTSPGPLQVMEQKLSEFQKREHLLQMQLAQLEEENQRLLAQLAGSQSQDSTLRKEREMMLRLKEVVDKQRDEIRAQAHEILLKTQDTEALQEQLNRFMSMNEELRHKLAIMQMQLKRALEKTEDLENVVLETRQELNRLTKTRVATEPLTIGMEEGATSPDDQAASYSRAASYSKEELQQILQERNELKTNLFLVQEELAYYQRELLNDERIPSLLLDAMKSTIKKQRKKIRAKMLGIVEEIVSSDEEEEAVCLTASDSDCVDGRLPESRIKNFFGLWYSSSSNRSSATAACTEPWEIVGPQDMGQEEEAGKSSCDSGSLASAHP